MGEAAVPGFDVEAARAGALAEQQRQLRAIGLWCLAGLVLAGVGFVLPLMFAVGTIAVAVALYTYGPYAFGARAAVLSTIGPAEIRRPPGTNTSRVEVQPSARPAFSGTVSRRSTIGGHEPAILFGNAERGGFVVAVVGLPDGSTRAFGIRAIKPI